VTAAIEQDLISYEGGKRGERLRAHAPGRVRTRSGQSVLGWWLCHIDVRPSTVAPTDVCTGSAQDFQEQIASGVNDSSARDLGNERREYTSLTNLDALRCRSPNREL